MIIDAHTHIGFNDVCGATVPELLKSMKQAKVDKSLVFAGEVMNLTTERLLKEISAHSDKLYAIGSISPLAKVRPSVKKVEEWLKTKQIRGLKFYPGYEYFYPADLSLRPYLKLLEKYHLPAIFHSGDTYSRVGAAKLKYAQAIHIDDLATEMPHLTIIIAHLGYPWVIDAAEVCYKNKNVYVDCSGFVYGKFTLQQKSHFQKVVKEFITISNAPERIIFGSDWPIGNQSSYVRTMQAVMGKNLVKLFSENAMQLFGIKK